LARKTIVTLFMTPMGATIPSIGSRCAGASGVSERRR